MLSKTEGIILSVTKYSDTSLISKIYTRDFGLKSFIINGVRSKKSKTKAVVFQPLSLVDVVVSTSNKSKLQRVSEINVGHPFSEIPYDILKSSIAIFLNEILNKVIKEESVDQDLYDYIKSSLLILDLKTDSSSNFHISFLLQLTRFLGFYPQGICSENHSFFDLREGRYTSDLPSHSFYLKKNQSVVLFQFLNSNYENLNLIKINNLERQAFLQSLILFYQLHLPGFGDIKSLSVLQEVLN